MFFSALLTSIQKQSLGSKAELLPLQNVPFGVLIILGFLFLRNKRLRKKTLNLPLYLPNGIQVEKPA